jgi:transposase
MVNYIGMDAHSSSCTFCVIDGKGRELDTTTLPTNGRMIVNYLRSIEGAKKLTFEECELSRWLFGIIKPEVDELIVCNPVANRDYKKAKTDKLDARKLSKLLRGDFLTPVYHDCSDQEKFRNLMSSYQDVVEEGVRLKNRYKSLFRKNGQKARGVKLYNDESLLEGLPKTGDRFIGDQMFRLIEGLENSRKEYLSEIIRQNKRFKETQYLKSIPGIGEIHSAKIVSQVVDPRRFASKYKFYSYCGLVRHPRDSGGKSYGTTRIWGNRILKCVYKTAGYAVLNSNNRLRAYYDKLRERGASHENAYNAVCRKIAAISLSVWKHGCMYDEKKVLF